MSVQSADFEVRNEGSIFILKPNSDAAVEWIDQHIADEAMTWGGGIVVEHRFIDAIIDGFTADGLTH